jgi:hypothetical protein
MEIDMKNLPKLLCTLLASLMLFSPVLAYAAVTDTSDGCPIGSVTSASGCTSASGGASTGSGSQDATLTACSSYFNPLCWLQEGAQWIAAILVSIAVEIMIVAGWLFDLAISQTVLGFNGWVTGSVLAAITTGWTFFRDVANIVIIGLFVFIAICIILGVKSYGQRSLIARVLVVAVLLNFSFLFTRMVINFSNALATQFASVQPLGASGVGAGTKPPDIAGKFTEIMGIKSIAQTKDTLALVAKSGNSTGYTLLHALFFIMIALGVAIVLLYGTILLIIRAVIFIFLLVTSSLAFSTYLLPQFASSDFGWKAWWTALFRNAMLAPILMLFLAITLQISTGIRAAILNGQNGAGGASGGTLGALAAHPEDPKNISALMLYLIILGLLYGAIRVSNRFAGAAGQMAWAGTLPFASATVAWPARSLGLLGRNTIGRGAVAISENLQQRAKAANLRNPGGFQQWGLDKLAQTVKPVGNRDFNAGNYTGVKSAQTKLGGFTGQEKRRADEIKARQKRNTPDKDELKASKAAIDKARTEKITVEGKETTREAMQKENQGSLESARALEKAAKASEDQAQKQKEMLQQEIQTLKQTAVKPGSNEETVIKKQIADKEGEMKKKTNDIDENRSKAQQESKKIIDLESNGRSLQEILEKRASQLMPQGKIYVPEANHKSLEKLLDQNIRQDAYQRFSNFLNRAAGQTIQQDKFAQNIVHSEHHDRENEEKSKANEKLYKKIDDLITSNERTHNELLEKITKSIEVQKDIKNNTKAH